MIRRKFMAMFQLSVAGNKNPPRCSNGHVVVDEGQYLMTSATPDLNLNAVTVWSGRKVLVCKTCGALTIGISDEAAQQGSAQ